MSETTHVCVKNKTLTCQHVKTKWEALQKNIFEQDEKIKNQGKDDEESTFLISFKYYRQENTGKINRKAGKEIKVLKSVQEKRELSFVMNFILELLPDIMYHRNHLKHCRKCHSQVHNFFNKCAIIDVDFSENLSVPVKFQPQSMHWCHQQVRIHSGITKINGEKTYHPYFSEDKTHDSVFSNIAIKEMLDGADLQEAEVIIIESDNYKSVQISLTFL